jgi:hypothetical protein
MNRTTSMGFLLIVSCISVLAVPARLILVGKIGGWTIWYDAKRIERTGDVVDCWIKRGGPDVPRSVVLTIAGVEDDPVRQTKFLDSFSHVWLHQLYDCARAKVDTEYMSDVAKDGSVLWSHAMTTGPMWAEIAPESENEMILLAVCKATSAKK